MSRKRFPAITLGGVWAAAAILLPIAVIQAKVASIDLAYHLRAGELMLRTHHLLRTNPFAFTVAGRPWTDQQWGSQIILGGVFHLLGWGGLAVLQTLLLGATFFFVYRACRSAGAEPRRAGWLTLGAATVASFGITLRPQLLGAVLFSASLWLVVDRRTHPRRLWLVPVLVAVWSNIHGTFFLGPLLLFLAAVEDRAERSSQAKRTLLVAFVAMLATLLNPFGLGVWGYVVSLSTNSTISNAISEWQAPSLRNPSDLIFFVSVLVAFMLLLRRARRVPWSTLLTIAVFFLIGVSARRSEMWWALAMAPVLARLLATSQSSRSAPRSVPVLNSVFVAIMAVTVLVTFPWSLIGADRTHPGSKVYLSLPGITTTLQQVARSGEGIFDSQKFGSWLEFAVPRNPVFIDSVIEVYPDSVWQDYRNVSNGREGWQNVLARWHADIVVLDRTQGGGLIPLIRRNPDWRLIHTDRDGLVFARAGPGSASSGA
jgi:hypothetical protein